MLKSSASCSQSEVSATHIHNTFDSVPTTSICAANFPHVTAPSFDVLRLSMFYGKPYPDEERFAVLNRAYEMGELNWDTADSYGDNEILIGNWFKRTGKCDEIFLATKFGNFWLPDGTRIIRNEPEYVHEACEKSLKRLGIETSDLYYCHRFNGKVPIEDVVGAMAELVKYLDLSECSAETLRRTQRVRPIAAVPIEHSPFIMDIEDPNIALLKTCRELGVATVVYSPLGRGISD